MRVVRPQHDLCLLLLKREVFDERIQRLCHVHITKIPGRDSPPKHRPVIFFRVLHQPGILFGVEEIIGCNPSVSQRVFAGTPLQIDQLGDYFGFTAVAEPQTSCIAILLRILAKVIETCVAVARALGSFRIDFVQVFQNCLDGGVQAIEVKSVEARLVGSGEK